MFEKIKELWGMCLEGTKDDAVYAMAKDGRLSNNTVMSCRQRYIYDGTFHNESEEKAVLEILQNALKQQNSRIASHI